jgi:hypothetical protein
MEVLNADGSCIMSDVPETKPTVQINSDKKFQKFKDIELMLVVVLIMLDHAH